MCNKEDEWGSVLLNHGANKTQDVPKPKGDQGEGEGEGRWCQWTHDKMEQAIKEEDTHYLNQQNYFHFYQF